MTGAHPLRAAVTSRDGISVNERMHRARDFFLFEVDGTEVKFLERRSLPERGERVLRDFDATARLLHDCQILVSLQFSGAAKSALLGKGFALEEARGDICSVLRARMTRIAHLNGTHPPNHAASENAP